MRGGEYDGPWAPGAVPDGITLKGYGKEEPIIWDEGNTAPAFEPPRIFAIGENAWNNNTFQGLIFEGRSLDGDRYSEEVSGGSISNPRGADLHIGYVVRDDGDDNTWIHCVFRDGRGTEFQFGERTQIIGCLSYNNGWYGPATGEHGQDMYLQNQRATGPGDTKYVIGNIFGGSIDELTVQINGSQAAKLDYITVEDNVFLGAPTSSTQFRVGHFSISNGAYPQIYGIELRRNLYIDCSLSVVSSSTATSPFIDLIVEDEYVQWAHESDPGAVFQIWRAPSALVRNNTMISAGQTSSLYQIRDDNTSSPFNWTSSGNFGYSNTGLTGLVEDVNGNDYQFSSGAWNNHVAGGSLTEVLGLPPADKVVVWESPHETNRLHVSGIDWDDDDQISFAPPWTGSVNYEIIHAVNYGSPDVDGNNPNVVATGTWTSGPITISLLGLSRDPLFQTNLPAQDAKMPQPFNGTSDTVSGQWRGSAFIVRDVDRAAPAGVGAWSPEDFGNDLVAWYRPNPNELWQDNVGTLATAGNSVRMWRDASGNGNHLDQASGVSQPNMTTVGEQINGNVGIKTDGVDDQLLNLFTSPIPQPWTIAAVIRRVSDDTSVNYFPIGGGEGGGSGRRVMLGSSVAGSSVFRAYTQDGGYVTSGVAVDTEPHSFVFNASTERLFIDGALTAGTTSTSELGGVSLGMEYATLAPTEFVLTEYMAIAAELTTSQEQLLINYLANEHAIP